MKKELLRKHWPSTAIMTVNNNRNHSYGNNGDDVDNMQTEL